MSRLICLTAVAVAATLAVQLPANAAPSAAIAGSIHPGCEQATPQQCVALAIAAMGGAGKLAGIHGERLDIIEHRSLAEQSYRQEPFLTAYARVQRTVDFDKGFVVTGTHSIWPQSDTGPNQENSTTTVVATPEAAVVRTPGGDKPGPLTAIDQARAILALGPERLLLNAAAAGDLHFMPDEVIRATPHAVVAFDWHGRPVKVLLNRFNHLPDAMESTRTFDDFWYAWGDVTQRVYFSNWKVVHGGVRPTGWVEERNGLPWASAQVLDATFNPKLDDKLFAMDAPAAKESARRGFRYMAFGVTRHVELAPGIDLFQGPWNVTLIKQDDGVLVLEAPIGPAFVKGVLDKAHELYPALPVNGVLTTSDSWPHLAGVREAVADGLPVYALDLNLPILQRMVAAPHTLRPDALQTHPTPARWIAVSGKRVVGRGPNRAVLYPLRGASTGRQYMVYFPARKLLYASDTLVLESPHKLYDPELMREVMEAVDREHLHVDTVFAMHQGPVPWHQVADLVASAVRDSATQ